MKEQIKWIFQLQCKLPTTCWLQSIDGKADHPSISDTPDEQDAWPPLV